MRLIFWTASVLSLITLTYSKVIEIREKMKWVLLEIRLLFSLYLINEPFEDNFLSDNYDNKD